MLFTRKLDAMHEILPRFVGILSLRTVAFINSLPDTGFVHFLRNVDRGQGNLHDVPIRKGDLEIATSRKLNVLLFILKNFINTLA